MVLNIVVQFPEKGNWNGSGTLVRYLNEIMWFPSAYLSEYIQWEPIDSNSAKATISVHGLTASAVLYFNEKGELTNFVAEWYIDEKGQQHEKVLVQGR